MAISLFCRRCFIAPRDTTSKRALCVECRKTVQVEYQNAHRKHPIRNAIIRAIKRIF